MRYFINLSYKGTNYHGWQIQANAPTVQSVLNDALSILLGETILTTGAGRTDTGVHAARFTAHFDSLRLADFPENPGVVHKLNGILPGDICVASVVPMPDDAHARFDAVGRTYKYYIHTHKSPFLTEVSTWIPFPLDRQAMNEAAQLLFQYTDFTSFAKLHTQTKTNLCRITQAVWEPTDSGLVFTISANRFLRNMVRAIVGALIDVGRGKIACDDMRRIIEQKNQFGVGYSVPAKGLFLTEITY